MTVDATEKPNLLTAALDWLRKGYPEGVPQTDYVPLLALLRHRLTDTELDHIVATLTASGHLRAEPADIDAAIAVVSDQPPSEDDTARVAARLAAAGWPLARPAHDPPDPDRIADGGRVSGD